jgi:hypothetical protein
MNVSSYAIQPCSWQSRCLFFQDLNLSCWWGIAVLQMFSKSEPRNTDAISGRMCIGGCRIYIGVRAFVQWTLWKICRFGLSVKLAVRLTNFKIFCFYTTALIGHILTSRGKARQTAYKGHKFTLVLVLPPRLLCSEDICAFKVDSFP